jgi:hypothetical protein
MSSKTKEENIPKRCRGRPRTVDITDMKTYKREYNREFAKKYLLQKISNTNPFCFVVFVFISEIL